MFNPYRFLKWCGNFNTNWLEFNNSPYAVSNFESFITRALRNRSLGEMYRETANLGGGLNIGLRMTIVDVK